jgi:hypothetical protein
MAKTVKVFFCWAVLALLIVPTYAASAKQWVAGTTARLQALDKITARISTIDVDVGMPVRFGSLHIIIHDCKFRPPTMAPEHAALVEIRSIDHHNTVADTAVFQGWMFASSPALNALEHPVYDVSILACKNE